MLQKKAIHIHSKKNKSQSLKLILEHTIGMREPFKKYVEDLKRKVKDNLSVQKCLISFSQYCGAFS